MDEKEKWILENASNHFLRYGYKKTCLDEIVKDARVGKNTLYTFFANKEELFKKMVEAAHEEMFKYLKKHISSEFNLEKKLILYVCKKIKYIRDSFLSRGSNLRILKELKTTYNQMVPGNCKEVAIITKILETGIETGVFKINDKKQTAFMISTIIRQFEISWIEKKPKEAETEVVTLFKILFKGIRG